MSWDPEDEKPLDAADLEAEMERIAPGARIKLTLTDGRWLVRALMPAAMCARGSGFGGRDRSTAIAEMLTDHDHPARALTRP